MNFLKLFIQLRTVIALIIPLCSIKQYVSSYHCMLKMLEMQLLGCSCSVKMLHAGFDYSAMITHARTHTHAG